MKRVNADIIPVISEYDKLIEEILELELKLAALAEEIDDLENHICVELRADYDQKVGNLKYQAQAYRLEIARLKRAIELLQAAINRQEAAKYEEVQKRVEAEYKEYEEDLHKKAEDMKRDSEYAKRRARKDRENEEKAEKERKTKGEGKTKEERKAKEDRKAEEERKDKEEREAEADGEKAESEGLGPDRVNETPAQELKRLYRYIMKKLHPDANPDATEAEMELLRKAQEAYSEGDLDTLRDIVDQLDDTEITEKYSDTPEDLLKLRELRDKLAEKVEILLAHIDEIKNSFPYTEKDFLADEEAVRARQEELEEYNRQCAEKIIELQEKILELSKVAEKNDKEARKRKAKKG